MKSKKEVYIVSTIAHIGDIEIYSDILALFTNLDKAEQLKTDLENREKTADYIYKRYNVDIECLAEYDGIVIFHLPLQ